MMSSSWRVCCARVPQRWVFAMMGCLALATAYAMRICMSLVITEMVATAKTSSNDTSSEDTCAAPTESTLSNSSSGGTYDWDEYTQGIILSSFYWGYIVTQMPGAIIAEKCGGKHTLSLSILSTAICSCLTPVVVQTYDATGLIVLRIMIGLCQGITFPAISVLIAQWAPPFERSKITGVVMSGMSIGTVVGNGLTGVLIQYSSIGWPIVFYFYGALGIVWFFVFISICYSRPDAHPFISEEEKRYLQETINEHCAKKHTRPTPWLHILTSAPVWAVLIGKAGFSWGFQVVILDLPKYMSSVLNFSIQANGLLSALPHVILSLVGSTVSWPADWLIKNEKLSRTNVRKICHTFVSVVPAIFIISGSYAGCDRTLVVTLFTIGVGLMGPYYITVMVNPNDLSPNYAGTLMALVNAIGALDGILVPYVIGLLTPNQTLSEWRLVFWITFGLFMVGAVVFHIWADGEVQYWNDLDSEIDLRINVESKRQANEDNVSSPEGPDQKPLPS